MLDTFFTQIKVRSRMESGPIGPYLSEIAAVLHCNGYARRMATLRPIYLIKEQALQKVAPAGQAAARFKPDDALLTFLASL
jgi:hypothetical protein